MEKKFKTAEQRAKIFCVVGTRPEFIKMFPVYQALEKAGADVCWVSSSQHKDLIKPLVSFFEIKEDFCLDLQDLPELANLAVDELINDGDALSKLASKILFKASSLFAREKPDLILVQGDTVTVQQVAQAAFNQKIPVAHIEAGLRTNDRYSPFPEEMVRRIVSQLASLHFAPTPKAFETLLIEKDVDIKDISSDFTSSPYGNPKNRGAIYCVGNTVVDTLKQSVTKIDAEGFDWSIFALGEANGQELNLIDLLENIKKKKMILVTAHRRENFGDLHDELVEALVKLLEKEKDIELVISLHKNPQARKVFEKLQSNIKDLSNVHMIEACNYPLFVKLMQEAYLILTDSGGIQEEAPYLQKPVLVFRHETERPEGIEAKVCRMAGAKSGEILRNITELLHDEQAYKSMLDPNFNLYGDGQAGERIAKACLRELQG